MKKSIFASLFGAVLVLASCGTTSKGTSVTNANDNDENAIRLWATEAPTGVIRAFASGTCASYLSENDAFAEATRNARAEIARVINTMVNEFTVDYSKKYQMSSVSSDMTQGTKEVVDNSKSSEGETIIEVKAAVSGAAAKKIVKTVRPNGAITYYVGVETDIQSVAKYVSKQSKVEELIAAEDKAKIDENRDEFEKKLAEYLNANKNR